MEKSSVVSRNNELRSLFKKCFENPMFSLVPFEVWRDSIVSNAELKTIVLLSQTCRSFKEIFDNIGAKTFNLALMLRREGQIDLAKKYLLLCAENCNSFAMFHVGFAYLYRGWGVQEQDNVKGAEWLKKSAELGNAHAMAYLSHSLCFGIGAPSNAQLGNVWGNKALLSNNSFAVGFCHHLGLGTARDKNKAFLCFERSANEGDGFGQEFLGHCFQYGQGTEPDHAKALYWRLKPAEQGNCKAQVRVGDMYRFGQGCEKDEQKAILWYKKAARQKDYYGLKNLKDVGIDIE